MGERLVENPSFTVFIDESGDEGFRFDEGSSKWFVLAAAIVYRKRELETVKLIDTVRNEINKHRAVSGQIGDKKALHFRDLKHDEKRFFSKCIGAGANLRTCAVLVHKPDLTNPEHFQKATGLYNHATLRVLERVTWLCKKTFRKDTHDGNGTIKIVLSNRSNSTYDELKSFLNDAHESPHKHDYRGEVSVFDSNQIEVLSPGRSMGLQIADAVASAHFAAAEPIKYGMPDPTYLRLMAPKAYRENGTFWGYGVKIFPNETDEKRRKNEILSDWDFDGPRT